MRESSPDGFVALHETLMLAHDPLSLLYQLSLASAATLLLTYSVAIGASRRWTYVKSHLWVVIDTIAASALVVACYQICGTFQLSLWFAIPLTVLWSGVIEAIVKVVDGGRALIDVDADRKLFFHTDQRLIRRAAALVLMWFVMYWSALSSGG